MIEEMKETFTDPRDGRVYRTVKIGEQVWMAENLNYNAPDSKFYDNDPANGEKYGRLYNWETAKMACPPGWHLPSIEEWDELVDFVGGKETAGKYLKAKSGWNGDGNGTDKYGFSALPGGNENSEGSFIDIGGYGYWWSASEYHSYFAYYRSMPYSSEYVGYFIDSKECFYPVRCLRD